MGTSPDVKLLIDAFDTFRKASATLEGSYKELERKIKDLNVELEEKNNFLTSVLEGLPVGVIVTGEGGRALSANQAALAILGLDESGLVGSELSSFLPLGSIKRDGVDSEAWLDSGEARKTITLNRTVLRNLRGEATGHLVVMRDVSEIKRLREAAQRDRRLKAMGEMAASIAHQIRNPLGSIELFASLLNDELKGDEENRTHAGEIIHAVRALNNTVSNMLLFAGTSTPRKAGVPLDSIRADVESASRFMKLDNVVSVERLKPGDDGAIVSVDRELMKQALINLVMNGVDAAGGAAQPAVVVSMRVLGDALHVTVSDNGPGIAVDDVEKVFDPFFTTKPRGTGLGLTVVSNIVKSHGGFIEAESANVGGGGGAAFHITLPAALGKT
jgi:PAS domain S-box-containing protein